MAVFDKFSCSCGKSPKQKLVLSEGFVNFLQVHSHNYRELMDLKIREYNYSFISRTHWPEDMSILASTHKPEDTRVLECEDTNKCAWTWGYEDVRMQVYKQAYMNLRIWGCKDTSNYTWTWGYEDARMRGYKHAHTNLRLWGCRDASKGTWAWKYEDIRMREYKPVHTNIRIWGCKETRIPTST